MDGEMVRERLEGALENQDLKYSLDVDIDEDNSITVSLSYEGDSFPRLGGELDEILDEDDYLVEMGVSQPEPDLPNTRSHTFTLTPIYQE